MSVPFQIIPVASPFDLEQARDLRRSVLCGELHWPREVVEDSADSRAQVWLAMIGPKPAATVRLIQRDGQWHIETLAVLERHRGRGLGSALLRALEEQARGSGVKTLYLVASPPETALFFEKQGYNFTLQNYGRVGTKPL